MAANNNETSNIVKTEIAKGEQNEVFEEYTRSEREEMRDKARSKISTKITVKVNMSYIFIYIHTKIRRLLNFCRKIINFELL